MFVLWPEADVSAIVCDAFTHVVPDVNAGPRSTPGPSARHVGDLEQVSGRPVAERAECLAAASACRPTHGDVASPLHHGHYRIKRELAAAIFYAREPDDHSGSGAARIWP